MILGVGEISTHRHFVVLRRRTQVNDYSVATELLWPIRDMPNAKDDCGQNWPRYRQIDARMVHKTQRKGPMPINRRSELESENENQSKYRYRKKKNKIYWRPSMVLLCYYMQK